MSIERQDIEGVRHLQLNRPWKKNAITQTMYADLAEAIETAEDDLSIGSLLISGAGDSFTAGNDLADFMATGSDPVEALSSVLRFLNVLARTSVPLVIAVEGLSVGVGVTMLLHADWVTAAAQSTFSTPFINLALVPEGGSTLLMQQQIGKAATTRLLMLGEELTAREALACGLVHALSPTPLREAEHVAVQIAAKPRAAMRESKRLLKAPQHEALLAAIDREGNRFAERLQSEEAQAAFAAFFTRRGLE